MRAALPIASLFLVLTVATDASAQCFEWSDAFGTPRPGTAGSTLASVVHVDGSGPALYLGGVFQRAGTTTARGVVRWDGSAWSALGLGIEDGVIELCAFDDGTGAALYAGGLFTTAGGSSATGIARWDGASWSAVGGGVAHATLFPWINALAVFDDGSGPALYAGGRFTSAGGVPALNVARWNGASWSALGTGLDDLDFVDVRAMAVFDEGAGPRLFVAGDFERAGGLPAVSIARWDGTSWSDVGGGLVGKEVNGYDVCSALAVYDDGSGPALYAGGRFQSAGAVAVRALARWDGSTWSSVGFAVPQTSDSVHALAVHDDGTGDALYALGDFSHVNAVHVRNVARWDGASWTALGTGVGFSNTGATLASFDDGTGADLYCGGDLDRAGDVQVQDVARWDGSSWSGVGPPGGAGLEGAGVFDMVELDVGTGPRLFAAGAFAISGTDVATLAAWDGTLWSGLPGIDGSDFVRALATWDDGTGAGLYAGGPFDVGVASGIARWDGAAWSALGGGVAGVGPGGTQDGVKRIAVHEDGGGAALFVTGDFATAGGIPASGIARWDGTSWGALGTGLGGDGRALASYDDGGGAALYAGGVFTTAGGVPANHVARWDGSTWSPLGTGLGGIGLPRCEALCVHDDGTGPALYAGGRFGSAGGVPSKGVARWDGASWSAVGGGVPGFLNQLVVHALFSFDDGFGPALYVGGEDLVAGGQRESLLRWDGTQWHELAHPAAAQTTPLVRAFGTFDAGAGETLFVGGRFTNVDGVNSISIAQRLPLSGPTCPNATGAPFCSGDGSGTACPCGNAGAPGHGCASSVVADGARLSASGDPAANTVAMHGSDLPSATTTVLMRSRFAPTPATGSVFGDGLLCVGTPVVRLGATVASGGLVTVPLNHLAGPGTFRYQLWYRNNAATFCDPAARFNLTNGFRIVFP